MIEDMTHLQVLADLQKEIYELLSHYNARANGITGKEALVRLRLAQFEALDELLERQERALRHMIGLPIEPQAHEGVAVLVGIGGGSAG